MREEVFEVEGVKSPWDDKFYLGSLMGAVNEYLGFGADVFYAREPGTLSEVEIMSMDNADGTRRICIRRIGEGLYGITGLLESEDFDVFKSNIRDVLDNYIRRIGPDKDKERSKAGSLERRSEEPVRQ
ncbi:MAG: hypothetical protein IIA87_02835 [Nanoarchaeota archaeon]|nr:hypothetical protein [Nanoarchaeota archaeon]